MSAPRKIPGLSGQLKEQLIRQVMERRLRRAEPVADAWRETAARAGEPAAVPEAYWRFDLHPGFRRLSMLREGGDLLGIANPYFRAPATPSCARK